MALSDKPVPCRRQTERKKPQQEKPMQVDIFKLTEETPETDKSEAMKHLIIAHLTSLLDDLKKL